MARQKENLYLSQWITGNGPEHDIVLSSRIRLARNFESIPFPNNASRDDLQKVINLVKKTLNDKKDPKLYYININELPEVEKQLLVEKNLTSPAHIKKDAEAGLFLNDKEDICIMINEEDHLRIQSLKPGLQLEKCWEKANQIDDILEEKINYAYSRKWGYLSTCPTNLGTGMRASIMIHLPALNLTNNIKKMLGAISKLGLAVRGIYGEGSDSTGNIYQISNQVTLGNNEQDMIENLKSVTTQIIEEEKKTRHRLLEEQEIKITDKIMRSYGILKYAHKLSGEEAMKLLSQVKLGMDMGIIEDIDPKVLSKLLILIRPAHLQKMEGKELDADIRDIKRATLIRNNFENKY